MPKRSLATIVLFSVALGAACAGSPPPNLFILEPLNLEAALTAAEGPKVVMEKISLPEYLDRAQIVNRDRLYEISLANSERWAEPLEDGIARVLSENLSRLIPSNRVTEHSWESPAMQALRLRVRLVRFGTDPGGDATVSAVWSLTDGSGTVRVLRRSEHRATPEAANTTSSVRALSESLAALSREIADAIRSAAGR